MINEDAEGEINNVPPDGQNDESTTGINYNLLTFCDMLFFNILLGYKIVILM